MQNLFSHAFARIVTRRRLLLASSLLLAVCVLPGCHEEKSSPASVTEPVVVHVMSPALHTIIREVGQPSFVEAYERTSIFPKMTGYIQKWKGEMPDIGDKVKEGQVLARLFVPELEEEWETKKALVGLSEEKIKLAREQVKVADADIDTAKANVQVADALLDEREAQVKRWEIQVERLTREVANGVVDKQVLQETIRQLESSRAGRDGAKAGILKAKAELLSKTSIMQFDVIAVKVADHDLKVAQSEAKRLGKLVDYLDLPAPFDGIIHVRNANTGDFVLPATGDPTAMRNSPMQSSGGAAPVYVVDRTDKVRIFVDIPEHDANYIKGDIDFGKKGSGTKARVHIKAFKDALIDCTVTRTSWALNVKSRTLRAEIDLPNTGSQMLPGMYAYGKVIIERPNVRSLPVSTIGSVGEKTYYWAFDNGKAHKVDVQTGISDGEWIEVTNKRLDNVVKGVHPWVPFDGTEKVIVTDDMSLLSEGEPVSLSEVKAAAKPSHSGH